MRGGIVAEKSAVCRSLGHSSRIALDVLDEAHVEHLVGLVEDDDCDAVEVERAAAHVVHHPAGRADHDLDAAAQRAELPVDRLAAVDRQDGRVLCGGRAGGSPRRPGRPARGSGPAPGPAPRLAAIVGESASSRSIIGSAKAAVLPVPVCAWPITSLALEQEPDGRSWIGVGAS